MLTADDVRVLAESEDELSRKGDFERVFPSHTSTRYLRFFEQQHYLNILLNQWEQKYWLNRSKGVWVLNVIFLLCVCTSYSVCGIAEAELFHIVFRYKSTEGFVWEEGAPG